MGGRTDTRIDAAGPVRAGESLDVAAVDAWLKAHCAGLTGSPTVTQYSGGASNWTYRLQYPQHDLILRRPPAGTKARGAHDMGREFRVQQALAGVFPQVPEMIALCEDESVIGTPFYVMRRIEGIILRRNLPPGLALSPDQARRLCLSLLDTLIELHRVDIHANGHASGLAALGKGDGYCRRQIEGWSERYRKARTWNVPRFTRVMRWLSEHTPADTGACLIHNDFRFDNLVLDAADPTHIVGVLDWEMATIGDPLMDLGNLLAYWVQADDDAFIRRLRRQPTHLPGMLSRREVIDYYCNATGHKPDSMAFYEVYGLFRLAVIVQQIYYRYHHRQTRNPAFKRFWLMVHYLHGRCRCVMARGER